jgi:PleD family two-component response regulator
MLHRIEDPPVVLIVDDSEEQVRFLRRLLTADGYRCQSVLHGSDAVAACAAGGIDIASARYAARRVGRAQSFELLF